ncbi:MAG: UDP-2,3-diacylglucosamine diphosphatase [Fimbriimonadaceae bacterium]
MKDGQSPSRRYQAGQSEKIRCRAAFISDLHLGLPAAQAKQAQEFLRSLDPERLYLVGDIFEMSLGRAPIRWSQSAVMAVRTILGLAKHGTKLYYTPGNHDSAARRIIGAELGSLSIEDSFEFDALNGKRYWVVHGDIFDDKPTWLMRQLGRFSPFYGYYGSAKQAIRRNKTSPARSRLKHIDEFFEDWMQRARQEAESRGFDGVICGHIHRPRIERDQMLHPAYINLGDWVEHSTAAIEYHDGFIELIHWNRPETAKVEFEFRSRQLEASAA